MSAALTTPVCRRANVEAFQMTAVDVLPETRASMAIRLLFLAGYDTIEMAALFNRREPEILDLFGKAPGPVKVEVTW